MTFFVKSCYGGRHHKCIPVAVIPFRNTPSVACIQARYFGFLESVWFARRAPHVLRLEAICQYLPHVDAEHSEAPTSETSYFINVACSTLIFVQESLARVMVEVFAVRS